MRLILLLLLLFSFPAYADFKDWTQQNQRLYMSAVTLHAMDAMQTFAMIECQKTNPHCPYIEKNLISFLLQKLIIFVVDSFFNLPPACVKVFKDIFFKFIPISLTNYNNMVIPCFFYNFLFSRTSN